MVVMLSICLLSGRLPDGNVIPVSTCRALLRLTLKAVMNRMGEMAQPWLFRLLPPGLMNSMTDETLLQQTLNLPVGLFKGGKKRELKPF